MPIIAQITRSILAAVVAAVVAAALAKLGVIDFAASAILTGVTAVISATRRIGFTSMLPHAAMES